MQGVIWSWCACPGVFARGLQAVHGGSAACLDSPGARQRPQRHSLHEQAEATVSYCLLIN